MPHERIAANSLTRFVDATGRLASISFIAIVAVIVFDVVTRRFLDLGLSSKMQELEWHLHTLLFSLCLGYGYLRDSHVRVDLVREGLGVRSRAVIELLGIALLLLPFLGVMIYFGIDFAWTAFQQSEKSSAGTGLSHRWIVKAFIPLGLSTLFIAGLTQAAVHARQLITGSTQTENTGGTGTDNTQDPDT